MNLLVRHILDSRRLSDRVHRELSEPNVDRSNVHGEMGSDGGTARGVVSHLELLKGNTSAEGDNKG